MKLYSDFGPRRTRQVIADLISLVLIAGWVLLGIAVHHFISGFAWFGEQTERAGAAFAQTMSDVGTNLGSVPLIGSGIRAPFDAASDAGSALEAAGANQQEMVHQAALVIGIGIAALPILMILTLWFFTRGRFIRRAARAQRMVRSGVGVDLLALRALTSQRIGTLAKVDPDVVGAWRRGDEAVMRRLAALELQSAGVRIRS